MRNRHLPPALLAAWFVLGASSAHPAQGSPRLAAADLAGLRRRNRHGRLLRRHAKRSATELDHAQR